MKKILKTSFLSFFFLLFCSVNTFAQDDPVLKALKDIDTDGQLFFRDNNDIERLALERTKKQVNKGVSNVFTYVLAPAVEHEIPQKLFEQVYPEISRSQEGKNFILVLGGDNQNLVSFKKSSNHKGNFIQFKNNEDASIVHRLKTTKKNVIYLNIQSLFALLASETWSFIKEELALVITLDAHKDLGKTDRQSNAAEALEDFREYMSGSEKTTHLIFSNKRGYHITVEGLESHYDVFKAHNPHSLEKPTFLFDISQAYKSSYSGHRDEIVFLNVNASFEEKNSHIVSYASKYRNEVMSIRREPTDAQILFSKVKIAHLFALLRFMEQGTFYQGRKMTPTYQRARGKYENTGIFHVANKKQGIFYEKEINSYFNKNLALYIDSKNEANEIAEAKRKLESGEIALLLSPGLFRNARWAPKNLHYIIAPSSLGPDSLESGMYPLLFKGEHSRGFYIHFHALADTGLSSILRTANGLDLSLFGRNLKHGVGYQHDGNLSVESGGEEEITREEYAEKNKIKSSDLKRSIKLKYSVGRTIRRKTQNGGTSISYYPGDIQNAYPLSDIIEMYFPELTTSNEIIGVAQKLQEGLHDAYARFQESKKSEFYLLPLPDGGWVRIPVALQRSSGENSLDNKIGMKRVNGAPVIFMGVGVVDYMVRYIRARLPESMRLKNEHISNEKSPLHFIITSEKPGENYISLENLLEQYLNNPLEKDLKTLKQDILTILKNDITELGKITFEVTPRDLLYRMDLSSNLEGSNYEILIGKGIQIHEVTYGKQNAPFKILTSPQGIQVFFYNSKNAIKFLDYLLKRIKKVWQPSWENFTSERLKIQLSKPFSSSEMIIVDQVNFLDFIAGYYGGELSAKEKIYEHLVLKIKKLVDSGKNIINLNGEDYTIRFENESGSTKGDIVLRYNKELHAYEVGITSNAFKRGFFSDVCQQAFIEKTVDFEGVEPKVLEGKIKDQGYQELSSLKRPQNLYFLEDADFGNIKDKLKKDLKGKAKDYSIKYYEGSVEKVVTLKVFPLENPSLYFLNKAPSHDFLSFNGKIWISPGSTEKLLNHDVIYALSRQLSGKSYRLGVHSGDGEFKISPPKKPKTRNMANEKFFTKSVESKYRFFLKEIYQKVRTNPEHFSFTSEGKVSIGGLEIEIFGVGNIDIRENISSINNEAQWFFSKRIMAEDLEKAYGRYIQEVQGKLKNIKDLLVRSQQALQLLPAIFLQEKLHLYKKSQIEEGKVATLYAGKKTLESFYPAFKKMIDNHLQQNSAKTPLKIGGKDFYIFQGEFISGRDYIFCDNTKEMIGISRKLDNGFLYHVLKTQGDSSFEDQYLFSKVNMQDYLSWEELKTSLEAYYREQGLSDESIEKIIKAIKEKIKSPKLKEKDGVVSVEGFPYISWNKTENVPGITFNYEEGKIFYHSALLNYLKKAESLEALNIPREVLERLQQKQQGEVVTIEGKKINPLDYDVLTKKKNSQGKEFFESPEIQKMASDKNIPKEEVQIILSELFLMIEKAAKSPGKFFVFNGAREYNQVEQFFYAVNTAHEENSIWQKGNRVFFPRGILNIDFLMEYAFSYPQRFQDNARDNYIKEMPLNKIPQFYNEMKKSYVLEEGRRGKENSSDYIFILHNNDNEKSSNKRNGVFLKNLESFYEKLGYKDIVKKNWTIGRDQKIFYEQYAFPIFSFIVGGLYKDNFPDNYKIEFESVDGRKYSQRVGLPHENSEITFSLWPQYCVRIKISHAFIEMHPHWFFDYLRANYEDIVDYIGISAKKPQHEKEEVKKTALKMFRGLFKSINSAHHKGTITNQRQSSISPVVEKNYFRLNSSNSLKPFFEKPPKFLEGLNQKSLYGLLESLIIEVLYAHANKKGIELLDQTVKVHDYKNKSQYNKAIILVNNGDVFVKKTELLPLLQKYTEARGLYLLSQEPLLYDFYGEMATRTKLKFGAYSWNSKVDGNTVVKITRANDKAEYYPSLPEEGEQYFFIGDESKEIGSFKNSYKDLKKIFFKKFKEINNQVEKEQTNAYLNILLQMLFSLHEQERWVDEPSREIKSVEFRSFSYWRVNGKEGVSHPVIAISQKPEAFVESLLRFAGTQLANEYIKEHSQYLARQQADLGGVTDGNNAEIEELIGSRKRVLDSALAQYNLAENIRLSSLRPPEEVNYSVQEDEDVRDPYYAEGFWSSVSNGRWGKIRTGSQAKEMFANLVELIKNPLSQRKETLGEGIELSELVDRFLEGLSFFSFLERSQKNLHLSDNWIKTSRREFLEGFEDHYHEWLLKRRRGAKDATERIRLARELGGELNRLAETFGISWMKSDLPAESLAQWYKGLEKHGARRTVSEFASFILAGVLSDAMNYYLFNDGVYSVGEVYEFFTLVVGSIGPYASFFAGSWSSKHLYELLRGRYTKLLQTDEFFQQMYRYIHSGNSGVYRQMLSRHFYKRFMPMNALGLLGGIMSMATIFRKPGQSWSESVLESVTFLFPSMIVTRVASHYLGKGMLRGAELLRGLRGAQALAKTGQAFALGSGVVGFSLVVIELTLAAVAEEGYHMGEVLKGERRDLIMSYKRIKDCLNNPYDSLCARKLSPVYDGKGNVQEIKEEHYGYQLVDEYLLKLRQYWSTYVGYATSYEQSIYSAHLSSILGGHRHLGRSFGGALSSAGIEGYGDAQYLVLSAPVHNDKGDVSQTKRGHLYEVLGEVNQEQEFVSRYIFPDYDFSDLAGDDEGFVGVLGDLNGLQRDYQESRLKTRERFSKKMVVDSRAIRSVVDVYKHYQKDLLGVTLESQKYLRKALSKKSHRQVVDALNGYQEYSKGLVDSKQDALIYDIYNLLGMYRRYLEHDQAILDAHHGDTLENKNRIAEFFEKIGVGVSHNTWLDESSLAQLFFKKASLVRYQGDDFIRFALLGLRYLCEFYINESNGSKVSEENGVLRARDHERHKGFIRKSVVSYLYVLRDILGDIDYMRGDKKERGVEMTPFVKVDLYRDGFIAPQVYDKHVTQCFDERSRLNSTVKLHKYSESICYHSYFTKFRNLLRSLKEMGINEYFEVSSFLMDHSLPTEGHYAGIVGVDSWARTLHVMRQLSVLTKKEDGFSLPHKDGDVWHYSFEDYEKHSQRLSELLQQKQVLLVYPHRDAYDKMCESELYKQECQKGYEDYLIQSRRDEWAHYLVEMSFNCLAKNISAQECTKTSLEGEVFSDVLSVISLSKYQQLTSQIKDALSAEVLSESYDAEMKNCMKEQESRYYGKLGEYHRLYECSLGFYENGIKFMGLILTDRDLSVEKTYLEDDRRYVQLLSETENDQASLVGVSADLFAKVYELVACSGVRDHFTYLESLQKASQE